MIAFAGLDRIVPQDVSDLYLSRGRFVFAAAFFAAASLVFPLPVGGQTGSRAVPRESYYLAFVPYGAGEFNTALSAFRDAARSGVQSTEGRWIDSICYYTMIGECLYQMGDLGRALDQYDAALKQYLADSNWMLRIEFPPTIGASSSTARSQINWGSSKRTSAIGQFPETMLSQQGRFDIEPALRQGGVIAPAELYPVRVQEIVRCTALAMSRRRELMGPTCQHDPLTIQLVAALSRRPAPPNHWSQSWVSALLGMAYASAGSTAQAVAELQTSLLAARQFDHALTGLALLELAKLAFEKEQFEAAATYSLEATYVAAAFDQDDVMEEAFRLGLTTHLVSNHRGLYPPLERAAAWARIHGTRPLQVSLALLAAENAASLGQTTAAATLLDQAASIIGRREMSAGAIGARYQYQTALVRFQQVNAAAGNAAIAAAMAFQKNSSRRRFQILFVDRLFSSGAITPRVAEDLFSNVLREPTSADWVVEPMETLSVVLMPHMPPMEHWFELLLSRKEPERALEVADRIRRQRFYSSLPLGGRLLALRWILEAPKESLDERALLQRQDLLLKYPTYADLSRQSAIVQAQLAKLPLVPADEKVASEQAGLLAQLAKLSAAQEMILHQIAVRREASQFVFPALRDVKDIQKTMPDGQLTLAFLATSRNVYGFSLTADKYSLWQIDEPAKVRKAVVDMLRAMGNYDKNQALSAEQLRDERWKTHAQTILQLLTAKAGDDLWEGVDELVVVPDNVLWYVPFEALQLPAGRSSVPLISKIRVRYAPTLSTTVPDDRPVKPRPNTAVVIGKMFPRDSNEVGNEAFNDLRRVLPDSSRLGDKLPAPSSLFASLCDRLVVLSDVDDQVSGAYDWSPLRIDRGKPGSALSSWLALPWDGPDQIVLPGFHSAAENSLKGNASGDELFLSVCGLMASGARTILISRWRTGGQSSYDLTREFVQELPHMPASRAWQRSVQLLTPSDIDPLREPRVQSTTSLDSVSAEHPFFWSGYLLIDTGGSPP